MIQIKKTITIICPVYNEEKNIEIFYNNFLGIIELKKEYNFTFLFCDNKSSDSTLDVITKLSRVDNRVSAISYSKNFGVMKSIFSGLNISNSDACAVFDCDLQDPPELLLEFISGWEKGDKIIYGSRKKRSEKFIFKFLRYCQKNIEFFFKDYNTTIESGAWFLDRIVVDEIKKSNFDPYLPGLISRLGFDSKPILYQRQIRNFGHSKFNYKQYIRYGIDGVISGTIRPLKISIFFAILFSTICFLSTIYFFFAKFFLKIVFAEGIAAIIIINLFGFSLLFFVLAIFSEYLGRIYSKDYERDLAIIEKKINL